MGTGRWTLKNGRRLAPQTSGSWEVGHKTRWEIETPATSPRSTINRVPMNRLHQIRNAFILYNKMYMVQVVHVVHRKNAHTCAMHLQNQSQIIKYTGILNRTWSAPSAERQFIYNKSQNTPGP